MSRIAALALAALACLGSAAAHAEDALMREQFDRLFLRWTYTLDATERLLDQTDIVNRDDLQPIRENLIVVRESATKVRTQAKGEVEKQRKLLEALGPAPKEDEPPESQEIVTKREALKTEVARFDARVKQSNIILVRTDELLKHVSEVEFETIADVLGKRSVSPLAPQALVKGFTQVPQRLAELGHALQNWWRFGKSGAGSLTNIGLFMAIVVTGIFLIERARRWALPRYGRDPKSQDPSLAQRLIAILVETLTRVVLPALLIGAAAFFFIRGTAIPAEIRSILNTLVFSALQYVIATGLSSTALSARQPQWRISRFTDDAANHLHRSIRLFAISLLIVNLVIGCLIPTGDRVRIGGILDLNFDKELTAMVGMAALVVITVFALGVLRKRNWRFVRYDSETETSVERPPWTAASLLLMSARAGLVGAVVMAAAGYLNFGIYLSARIVWTLALVALTVLVRGVIIEGLKQATSSNNRFGIWIRERAGIEDAAARRLVFWTALALDVVLVVVAVTLSLLLWSVPWADLKLGATTLLSGIQIGGLSFSLTNVLIAIGVFVALLIGIRVFKRFLSDRVLAQTTLDVGVRDAVTTGAGYIGVVIAVLVAISLLGVELTKLALILGALSVGIGFGLQHIVNNFISGIILLVQRPIKAGDWIVLGSNREGYVKHINVISTEVQTFDNASVIVPNSELVSNEVLNWMHKSKVGRATITVGVAYDSDPEAVRDLLISIIERQKEVLKRPAPDVLFRDFGDSALIFELRFFLRDVDRRLRITSNIRYKIKHAFKEAGIEIPFPQRDIHVRSGAADLAPVRDSGIDAEADDRVADEDPTGSDAMPRHERG
ncbi:MAG: mechanosensitive ion channel [Gammaproteobacteria bacterium]|nr:mechanosensitive ion channel [Gammaproteobacteria bacterium]